jgi:diaminopropionate ammonia-lyase
MAGLRSGRISPSAWPAIRSVVDAFASIDDAFTEEAMRLLARPAGDDPPVVAGASGACGLGVLLALSSSETLAPIRKASGLGPGSRVLIINTEGKTDPEHYARVVG